LTSGIIFVYWGSTIFAVSPPTTPFSVKPLFTGAGVKVYGAATGSIGAATGTFGTVLSAVPDEGFSASRVRASLGCSGMARVSTTVSGAAICSGFPT
jgi:hypothetical protein|tara:strand:- start:570 stop:860 length:291 start_codon:yes stop_codon:yes gene_type:complete